MGFNYGYEKKKFDSRWKRLEVEYCDAGMSEEQIAAMKEYDWAWFCSQMHTPLQESSKTADDGASAPHEWCGCFGCMVHSGRRHGAHGRRAFPLFGNTFALAHGFTLDLDGVGVVDDPVTDGVGQGGVVQVLVPLAGVVLGAEDGGGHLAPGLY